jgi:hypothetical protein
MLHCTTQGKDVALSHELLNKALLLTEPAGSETGSGLVRQEELRRRLRAVTYNNFGCFFRKRGKLHSALQMLDKALRLELLSKQVRSDVPSHTPQTLNPARNPTVNLTRWTLPILPEISHPTRYTPHATPHMLNSDPQRQLLQPHANCCNPTPSPLTQVETPKP